MARLLLSASPGEQSQHFKVISMHAAAQEVDQFHTLRVLSLLAEVSSLESQDQAS